MSVAGRDEGPETLTPRFSHLWLHNGLGWFALVRGV
jgi:hypothetical protein